MPEKVLLVCTSTVANLKKAQEVLRSQPIFDQPEFHFLCSPSDLPYLRGISSARQVWVFPHRRDLWSGLKLWLGILKQRYDSVVVLWCLDRGRLRQKLFALACGTYRVLIFNEHLDCSYLNPSFLRTFLAARARDGHWSGGLVGRVLLAPMVGGSRALLRVFLFPVRLVALIGALSVLYVGRRSSRSRSEPPQGF